MLYIFIHSVFTLEKMTGRLQPIQERKWKQYISNFTFYLTHSVIVNTSTVTYMTHLVPAGNMDYRNSIARRLPSACFYSFFAICRRKQYIRFADNIVIISVSVIVSTTISYLIDKTFCRLQCSRFLRLWLAAKLPFIA